MNKEFIIVNKKSNESRKALDYLRTSGLDYKLLKEDKQASKIIVSGIKKGLNNFILCGGDGTINNFVKLIMVLPASRRKKIRIGIIPCGRANDLARNLKIPRDIVSAIKIIKSGRTKKIDLIKINNKYIVTGGGFGLPSEVISNMENSSKKSNFLSRMFKSLVYYLFVLKLIFFGYKGVKVKNKEYMAVCILNQGFIGKRFNIYPESNNSDGIIEIGYILRERGLLKNFAVINKIKKGTYFKDRLNKIKEFKKIRLSLDTKSDLMGDGEILESRKEFKIEVMPKALSFFC